MRGLLSRMRLDRGRVVTCETLFVRCFGEGGFPLRSSRFVVSYIDLSSFAERLGRGFVDFPSTNLLLALNSRQICLFLRMCVLGRVRFCTRFTTLEMVGGKNNVLLCCVNMHVILLIQCGSSFFVRLGISFTEEVFNSFAFALLLECPL